jgi:hypothetical protein
VAAPRTSALLRPSARPVALVLLLALPGYGLIFFLGLILFVYRRKRQLGRLSFHLRGPEVPVVILDAVRDAEGQFYLGLGPVRRIVEDVQDVISFLSPGLIYALNLSVGPYRIKPQSVAGLLDGAIARGYLAIDDVAAVTDPALLSYLSMQPVINQWQAALLLQHLKDDHPQLAALSWPAIASEPRLTAKLYSGYMGAGGDWDGWRATLEPGRVAKRRMGPR